MANFAQGGLAEPPRELAQIGGKRCVPPTTEGERKPGFRSPGSFSSPARHGSLRSIAPRSEQRAGKEGVFPVHLPVSIEIQPPATADVARIARAELGLQADRACHLQFLEGAMLGQRAGGDDGIVVEALAGHIDDRAVAPPALAAAGGKGRGDGNRQAQSYQKCSQTQFA